MKKSSVVLASWLLASMAFFQVSSAQVSSPFSVAGENAKLVAEDPPPLSDIEPSPARTELSVPNVDQKLDTVFVFIKRNYLSLRKSDALDLRSFNVNDSESSQLKPLIQEYYRKYSEPDLSRKMAMCDYFISPNNQDEPETERALHAFELLESQGEMENRWESIGNAFLSDIRLELGENIFQNIQFERDNIYPLGSSYPLSSKEFIIRQNFNITTLVIGNCTGGNQ
ncbi:MAG TPA: hypothetical protein DCM64_12825 [Gammaproteobacteria bacterium]|jgi:hypothetical protein|nr:hypothetical protein [Gammaproteobacteria bacterium]MDP6733221.1 hypothetical protein [Gammaproteobacteria bacterium]HAJ77320.1 hypothetical protein [Gammaproteobacteria bacterium]|tara:strand:- start:421 stop:1098 length:678 start_codon:yes stop_codon:yes gene_type:complete